MGAPDEFLEDDFATLSFEGEGLTSVMLWRPGILSRYGDRFAEEFIELWGIEPTVDDPQQLAAQYNAATWRDMESIIRRNARVWLLYTDSTCWEIYTSNKKLLDEIREHLREKPWVDVFESNADQRATAFRTAGLAEVWIAMEGDNGDT